MSVQLELTTKVKENNGALWFNSETDQWNGNPLKDTEMKLNEKHVGLQVLHKRTIFPNPHV